MTFIRNILTAAASITVAATAIAGTPAQAQGNQSIRVRYADLNLASAQGKAVLHQRISGAVNAACGKADNRDLPAMNDLAACRKKAWAGVETQLAAIDRGQHLAALDLTVGSLGR